MSMSAEEIANAFVTHFYTTLDSGNYAQLTSLYQPNSTLTFEGTKFEGATAIVGKYSQVGQVTHNIAAFTKDVQLSTNANSMIIFISGHLKIGQDGNPLHFAQVFQLVAVGPNQFYIHNDLFRLIYG